METPQEKKYLVVITVPAENSFYEILEYLYEYYSIDRAEQIASEIRDTAGSLRYQAERGAIESRLSHRKNTYRFILYKRTSRSEIKIIYYIDKQTDTVYITDFFPTEKDDQKISKRS